MLVKNIFIASPVYAATLSTHFFWSLHNTCELLREKNIKYQLQFFDGPYLDHNRNTLIIDFMKSDYDYIFFLDTDVVWNPNQFINFLQKVDSEVNVLSGLYPNKKLINDNNFILDILNNNLDFETHSAIPHFTKADILGYNENKKLLEFRKVPAGFLLLSKTFLQKIADNNKDLWYTDSSIYSTDLLTFPYFKTVITNKLEGYKALHDTNFYLGEDFYFCNLVKKENEIIWADPDINLGHQGTHVFRCDWDIMTKNLEFHLDSIYND